MQKIREFMCIVAMALVALPATRRSAFSQLISSPTIHSLQPDDLPWDKKTKRDLAFIKSALLENHPATGGLKDKSFERWFSDGYAEAVHRADAVSNLPGYFFTLKHFVNGFADFHLRVGFSSFETMSSLLPLRWPGFVTGNRNGTFVVLLRDQRAGKGRQLPPLGSRLESCDGRSVQELLRTNVFPYYGIETISSHKTVWGPRLLVDAANPFISRPKTCVFQADGHALHISLDWQPISLSELWPKLDKAANTDSSQFGLRKIGDSGLWLYIPTFAPNDRQQELFRQALEQLKKNRLGARYIVFDLRGNKGGDSRWMIRTFQAALGTHAASAAFKEFDKKYPQIYLYRASKGNLDLILKTIEKQKKVFGESPFFKKVAPGLAKAVESGQPYFRLLTGPEVSGPTSPVESETKAKLFALTDGYCASACLSFMDIAYEIPSLIHIGLPTDADSTYNQIRDFEFANGTMSLELPILKIENGKRKNNEAYEPKILWSGEIDDTPAIEKQIKKLVP